MGDVKSIDAQVSGTNVTVTTTAETVAITSDPVNVVGDSGRFIVRGWAKLTTGAGTTAVTPRIRRGTTASGTLLGEANAEQVKAAAGSTEHVEKSAVDDVVGGASLQYVLTVEQAGATGNGTVVEAGIEVIQV